MINTELEEIRNRIRKIKNNLGVNDAARATRLFAEEMNKAQYNTRHTEYKEYLDLYAPEVLRSNKGDSRLGDIFFGMAMQAGIASTLAATGLITISATQQAIVFCIFILVSVLIKLRAFWVTNTTPPKAVPENKPKVSLMERPEFFLELENSDNKTKKEMHLKY